MLFRSNVKTFVDGVEFLKAAASLEPGCVLLEVKAGPFDPNQPKDLAPWAPVEGSVAAADYLNRLLERIAE